MNKNSILVLLVILLVPIMVSASSEISFVMVKGSNFQMKIDNNNSTNQVRDENVADFYMSKYEITQTVWQELMESNPSRNKKGNNPVENISWHDAVEFCNKKSISEKLQPVYSGSGSNIKGDFSKNGYRLPTEAEWEFAVRGGVKSRTYKFGSAIKAEESDETTQNSDVTSPPVLPNIRIRHTTNTLKGGDGGVTYKPVGSSQPNELGIYDLVGNVFEYCWESKGNYSLGTRLDPVNPKNSSDAVGFRVVKKVK